MDMDKLTADKIHLGCFAVLQPNRHDIHIQGLLCRRKIQLQLHAHPLLDFVTTTRKQDPARADLMHRDDIPRGVIRFG